MKRYPACVIILSILASVFNYEATAQCSRNPDEMQAVISSILANNPDLKARQNDIRITSMEGADANAPANPEVGLTQVWGANGVGNKLELEVSQSFDWPGVYRARSQASKAGTAATQMLYRSARLETALQAKLKLIELVYLNQQLGLLNRIKANTDSVQAKVEEGYRGGELTILDSKKMQIEQYNLSSDIADVTESICKVKTELQAMCPDVMLNLNGYDTYPVEPVLSADEYTLQIASLDPVIAAGNYAAEQAALSAKAARMQHFPGFSVGYIYQAEMGDKFNGFSLGITLPFFQNRKAKAIELARADNARLSNLSAEAARRAEVHNSIHSIALRREQIDDYERVFGDNSYPDLLLQAYRGGQINVIDYLSEVNYFYETTRQYLDCKYQYCRELASLNRYTLLNL